MHRRNWDDSIPTSMIRLKLPPGEGDFPRTFADSAYNSCDFVRPTVVSAPGVVGALGEGGLRPHTLHLVEQEVSATSTKLRHHCLANSIAANTDNVLTNIQI